MSLAVTSAEAFHENQKRVREKKMKFHHTYTTLISQISLHKEKKKSRIGDSAKPELLFVNRIVAFSGLRCKIVVSLCHQYWKNRPCFANDSCCVCLHKKSLSVCLCIVTNSGSIVKQWHDDGSREGEKIVKSIDTCYNCRHLNSNCWS